MITCKDAVARLWEYLEENLGRVSEGELEQHLEVCRHCCGEMEFTRQLRELLRRPTPLCELPDGARTRLEAVLTSLRPR